MQSHKIADGWINELTQWMAYINTEKKVKEPFVATHISNSAPLVEIKAKFKK